jgi:hypothetical protein
MRLQNVKWKANQHPLITWPESQYAQHVKHIIEGNAYLRIAFRNFASAPKMYWFSFRRGKVGMLIAKLQDLRIATAVFNCSYVVRWRCVVWGQVADILRVPMCLQNIRNYLPNNNVTSQKNWHLNYHIIYIQQNNVLSTSTATIMV